MKIEFTKDHNLGRAGYVREVTKELAKELIKLKVAREVVAPGAPGGAPKEDGPQKKAATKKEK